MFFDKYKEVFLNVMKMIFYYYKEVFMFFFYFINMFYSFENFLKSSQWTNFLKLYKP